MRTVFLVVSGSHEDYEVSCVAPTSKAAAEIAAHMNIVEGGEVFYVQKRAWLDRADDAVRAQYWQVGPGEHDERSWPAWVHEEAYDLREYPTLRLVEGFDLKRVRQAWARLDAEQFRSRPGGMG